MGLWSQSDIDTLKAAVASGCLECRFNGPPERLIRYQDLGEMRKLLASMQAQVSRSAGGSSYVLAATSKGL